MPELPYIPSWESIHPLLIHFPLVLFFLVPVFVLFAVLAQGRTRQTLVVSGISVMLLGLVFLYAAFETGQTGAPSVSETEARKILDRHMEFAGFARNCFTTSILLVGLCILICRLLRVNVDELSPILPGAALTFYALGLLWLVNAAYNGERLVHEFGIGRTMSP